MVRTYPKGKTAKTAVKFAEGGRVPDNDDALKKRREEIATYNEITGSGAPLPKADPRGEDYRAVQRRRKEIEDYEELTRGK
jgi:hypothetical protein